MIGLTDWWRNRTLTRARARLGPGVWSRTRDRLPLLAGLNSEESLRLRDLALLFLNDKAIEEVEGVSLDESMRLRLALQACLPILNLGLDWYRGWYAVIVYPNEFAPKHEWVDENGLVWVASESMSGEAWEQGPVILSWTDVEAGDRRDGYNLVVHELSHKLDMRDGRANGHPPLHAGMSDDAWSKTFNHAYADMVRRLDGGEETPIDPYATQSPAEFFAVVSEAFFELPHMLDIQYPEVYRQLRDFYRQDPLRRLRPLRGPARPERR